MKGVFQGIMFVGVWTFVIFITIGIALLPLALHLFLLLSGAEQRAVKAIEQLSETLMQDETIVEEGIQKRIFALWSRRAVIAITKSRMIIVRRGLFGGFNMTDIQWKDLRDATLEQNVLVDFCGSNLQFAHSKAGAGSLIVNGIERQIASQIYSFAQSEEQAWEEKRRVREMEEVRAASGGITIGGGMAPSAPSEKKSDSVLDELEQAKRLLDMDAISDAEYNEMKAKILARP